ncbi:MAG: hypothetical protein CVT77_01730 [Alphaproteobacteria bacterium HGW-Alphaproteobacteria-16]|nr:MAG: hypothetical protein CVT77_01730 [Alphaproteobacteria bacterium HGW-Alphaproteobacteria-16]
MAPDDEVGLRNILVCCNAILEGCNDQCRQDNKQEQEQTTSLPPFSWPEVLKLIVIRKFGTRSYGRAGAESKIVIVDLSSKLGRIPAVAGIGVYQSLAQSSLGSVKGGAHNHYPRCT